MPRDRTVVPVSIASGQSLSTEVNVGSGTIVGIIMPLGWDAAGITFAGLITDPSALPKAPTFGKVQDAGGVESLITTPAASIYVALSATLLRGLGRIKVRSGTSGTPVNQTAQRDFALVVVSAP